MALEILNDTQFRKQIKSEPGTGYLLFGEEDYLKSFALSAACEALCPDRSLSAFNELTLDALDYDAERLRGMLMAMPMMADRKVVILRGMRFADLKPREIDALCEVLEELGEYDYNTLLLVVSAGVLEDSRHPNRIPSLLKRLSQYLTPVRFDRCTPQKLIGWCIRHFEHNGAKATPATCQALIDHCGRSMFTLAGEIDKLSFYALSHGREEVTAKDIATAACRSPEYDAYALTNAVMARQSARALDVLADLKFRRVEPILVLAEIVSLLQDMQLVLMHVKAGKTHAEIASMYRWNEYRVKLYSRHASALGEAELRRLILRCTEADLALKSAAKGYEPLETLVCSI